VAIPLLIVLPILAILAGVFAWVLAGRALQPVEAIRAEVADILGAATSTDAYLSRPFDDEVSRLARTMNAMLARIETTNEGQRQIHLWTPRTSLRSPLAALLAQVEVARTHPEKRRLAGGPPTW